MATSQTQTTTSSTATLRTVGGETDDVPEWIFELRNKGWTVVKEAVAKEKALEYADKAYSWLEGWDLGYKRDDPSKRSAAYLPFHHRGGIYARHGVAHEQWVWDLKGEPGLVDAFAKIWGTDELLVSYDGVNLSIPEAARPKTDPVFQPWAHVDQSPLRTNLQCVQGILNLLPNGPDDGGLMVLEGSNKYYTQLWEHFDERKGPDGWNKWEQQFLDEDMCRWLEAEGRGCRWVKVNAEPGDLMLWDSRCVHYGAPPSSTNDRFAAYVCYKPAALVSDETKRLRLQMFEAKEGTAHDPSILRQTPRLPPEDHHSYEAAVKRPLQQPVLNKRQKQLAGLVPY